MLKHYTHSHCSNLSICVLVNHSSSLQEAGSDWRSVWSLSRAGRKATKGPATVIGKTKTSCQSGTVTHVVPERWINMKHATPVNQGGKYACRLTGYQSQGQPEVTLKGGLFKPTHHSSPRQEPSNPTLLDSHLHSPLALTPHWPAGPLLRSSKRIKTPPLCLLNPYPHTPTRSHPSHTWFPFLTFHFLSRDAICLSFCLSVWRQKVENV